LLVMPPPSLDLISFSLPFFFSIRIGILGLKVRGKGRREGGRWGDEDSKHHLQSTQRWIP
jgi:hypothetical protein